MKLSKKGEYALRALIDLSLNYEKGIVKIQDILYILVKLAIHSG